MGTYFSQSRQVFLPEGKRGGALTVVMPGEPDLPRLVTCEGRFKALRLNNLDLNVHFLCIFRLICSASLDRYVLME